MIFIFIFGKIFICHAANLKENSQLSTLASLVNIVSNYEK